MINSKTVEISPQLLAIIAEIDEFKGAWRALGTLAPERLAALKRVATIESIGSSTRIEGSKLTDREVEALLGKLQIQTFETRDEQEVAGYASVMDTIFESWRHITPTEGHIKQLHRDLLAFSAKDERHRGAYKIVRNDVAAFDSDGNIVGIVFQTASPFDTPERMKDLIAWYAGQKEQGVLHPLIRVGIFIVTFLEIHPFQDGNGRLSRVLTTLLLLQEGYVYVPYASLESVIENNKEGYYLALRKTQATIRTDSPEWSPWLLFFMQVLARQKANLARKLETEHRYLSELSDLAVSILNHAKQHGKVTNRDIVKTTGASANTVKATFGTLVSKRLLRRNGAGRSTWYTLV